MSVLMTTLYVNSKLARTQKGPILFSFRLFQILVSSSQLVGGPKMFVLSWKGTPSCVCSNITDRHLKLWTRVKGKNTCRSLWIGNIIRYILGHINSAFSRIEISGLQLKASKKDFLPCFVFSPLQWREVRPKCNLTWKAGFQSAPHSAPCTTALHCSAGGPIYFRNWFSFLSVLVGGWSSPICQWIWPGTGEVWSWCAQVQRTSNFLKNL